MKIYHFSIFLLIINLLAAFFCSIGVVPVQIDTVAISSEDIRGNIPENIEYSDSDLGLYAFGDFPRALGMLTKLFFYSPIILCLLMGQAGFSPELIDLIKTVFLAVYMSGIAQIIMKFKVRDGA